MGEGRGGDHPGGPPTCFHVWPRTMASIVDGERPKRVAIPTADHPLALRAFTSATWFFVELGPAVATAGALDAPSDRQPARERVPEDPGRRSRELASAAVREVSQVIARDPADEPGHELSPREPSAR